MILVVLGLVSSLWWNMGTKLGRTQLHVGPVGRFSLARTSLESRVETPRLPGLKSQVWRIGAKCCVNSLVETVLPAAMGPCAPSELVPFSFGFVVTSEHAVISGLSAGSFAPVQGISRVDCAVTHGFDGVESVPRDPASRCFSLLVSRSHVNMPGFLFFLLCHQLRCKAHLASTVLSLMDSMEPCLVCPVEKSRLLHTSQGLNPMWTRSMHMLVILESNWCLAPCTLAERNATRRRSSAIPKRSRKLNGMRDANSLHNLRSAMKPLS